MTKLASFPIRSGDVVIYEQAPEKGYSREDVSVYIEDGMGVGSVVQWVSGNSRYEWVANADVATLDADVRVLIDDAVYDKDKTTFPAAFTLATLMDDSMVGRTFLNYADAVSAPNKVTVEAALKARNVKVVDQVPANS